VACYLFISWTAVYIFKCMSAFQFMLQFASLNVAIAFFTNERDALHFFLLSWSVFHFSSSWKEAPAPTRLTNYCWCLDLKGQISNDTDLVVRSERVDGLLCFK